MSEVFSQISFGHFFALSTILFCIGATGVLIRRNAIVVLMSIELMLNASNIALITFARMHGGSNGMVGQAFAFVVIAVAAAEAAIGLAIVVQVFRTRGHVNLDELDRLKN